jgi:hypothetical protein
MLKQVIEVMELLDSANVNGERVAEFFNSRGAKHLKEWRIQGDKGYTDFVKIQIYGTDGKRNGGSSPTLGIIGRLGGIGARPEQVGIVSDSDGATTALSTALKIIDMGKQGDFLRGDVIITTHICPNAPIKPHHPVPFMGSPVDIATMNDEEIDPEMDAILSIDTTKGNRIANWRGFAITPTAKEGWILKVSESLLDIMEWVSGEHPKVCPITTQDITPYGNDLDHINSIMQPTIATDKPVVGVAITSQVPVPGCSTGASHPTDIELAARYCLEVAKQYGRGLCTFYDENEWQTIMHRYGALKTLQTLGKQK